MRENKKATWQGGAIDNQKIYAGGINNGQISFDCNYFMPKMQCKNKACKSDYLRHSVNGFCQSCLQRLEYYRHEQPQKFAKIVANLQGGIQ